MRRFIESLKREGNEAIIEAVLNGYSAIFENNLMESIGPVYHGTNDKFEKFDLDKTTMGDIWFTDNKEKIIKGESGASGTKYIMERYLNIPEEKLAGWDLYDKHLLGELINMGYRGVKLPGKEGTDYIVFNPDDIVKKENLHESERTGGKKLSEYPRYQYANSVTIFRARNTNDTTFNTNDYVTLSPKFAVEHAESTHVYEEEPQQVIKANVKPDLIVDASNPGEYFYIGEPIEGKSVYTTKGEEYEGNIPNLMEAVYLHESERTRLWKVWYYYPKEPREAIVGQSFDIKAPNEKSARREANKLIKSMWWLSQRGARILYANELVNDSREEYEGNIPNLMEA